MAKGFGRSRKAARGIKAAGRSIGPFLRLFGVAAIGCAAAGAAVLMYPRADEGPATALRSEPTKATTSPSKIPEPVRAAAAPVPQPAAQTSGAVSQIPASKPAATAAPEQTASVPAPPLPTPAAVPLPPAATAYVPLPPPAPARSAEPAPAPAVKPPEQTAPTQFAGAAVDCLAPDLVTVLRDVQARFGQVTVVSGKELHTRNHSPGSARHKLHSDCKAVDFTVPGDAEAVMAFLKGRPEVNGINSYRPNGLIHIDLNERRRLATR